MVDTASDRTEILENPITRTPILSFSSPTSLDSINDDDVFRTPPENAYLSSATADSESRLRFPEMKPDSKLQSPSSKTETTMPFSSSPSSLLTENARVLETNRLSGSPSSVPAGNVRVRGKNSDIDSPSLSSKLFFVENLKQCGLKFPK
ncbi:unnamed protein product [Microthlaspi erraticum]|uniref:Uncharacterized protein n=1 Tax=Microthlaspi erraticum TaxID=1685480 RepID=A0A6D2HH93_9BRAS|nr:unnamed protein product [Microthlaspi erraticum]